MTRKNTVLRETSLKIEVVYSVQQWTAVMDNLHQNSNPHAYMYNLPWKAISPHSIIHFKQQ